MQTFKSYISGNATNRKSVQLAFDLLMRGIDPEKFILDFTEDHCPHIFTELILEADGPVDDPSAPDAAAPTTGGGGTNPAISKATGEFNKMMGGFKQASDEMGISGLIGKIASWFGGGGPQKQFDKAMQALGKVRAAFHVKPSDEIKNSDKRFADYDKFLAGLDEAIKTLGGFKQAPAMLAAIEQLQKNPEKFVLDDAGAKDAADKLGDEIPKDPGEEGEGGDAKKGGMDMDAMAVSGSGVSQAAIDKYRGEYDAGRFTTFDTAKQAEAQKEYEPIKAMPAGPKKDLAVANFMKKFGSPGLKEHRRRRGEVFSEALVLAGIPTRRK